MRVVINHGSKPNIAESDTNDWKNSMQDIAQNYPDVYCKLSGLLTEAGDKLQFEHIQPYFNHLLECFSDNRLMWGSDWPVLTLAESYDYWFQMVQQMIMELPEQSCKKIMGGNAQRFYQL